MRYANAESTSERISSGESSGSSSSGPRKGVAADRTARLNGSTSTWRSTPYHTLRDAQTNYCVCMVMGITGDHSVIDPGNNATYYDAYTLPGDISRVTVEIPGFVAVKNVPIN